MGICASKNYFRLKRYPNLMQSVDYVPGNVARIAATHSDENFFAYSGNFAFPVPPLCKLAAKHGVARAKQQTGVRLAATVKTRVRVGLLVKHKVGGIVASVAVVIHEKQLQSSRFQLSLIVRAELISIHDHPLSCVT